MGHSVGTRFAPMMLATEPPIRAAVLLAGAMRPVGALPEADPVNFLPRVIIPVLHVTGRYHASYPVELATSCWTTTWAAGMLLLIIPPLAAAPVTAHGF